MTTEPDTATIAKRFTFDAAHRLDRLPANHKCNRVHGHTYEVEVVLYGPVDQHTGMVVDYADVATGFESRVFSKLDHQYLNDIPGLEVPTTEILARWILRELVTHPAFSGPRLDPNRAGRIDCTLITHVRVKESSSTWCEVSTFDAFKRDLGPIRTWSFFSPLGSCDARGPVELPPRSRRFQSHPNRR